VILKLLTVFVRDTEHFADQQRRNRLSVRRHQIQRRTVALHRIQRVGGDLRGAVGQLSHPADRELAGEQPAVPGVVGCVDAAEVTGRGRRQLVGAGNRIGQVQQLVS
jgi:hypothetical protein